MEPVLPSLALPGKLRERRTAGLGPVEMNDPMHDEAQTLVSMPNPLEIGIPQEDEPLVGGTQVASPPANFDPFDDLDPVPAVGGTQVAASPADFAPALAPPLETLGAAPLSGTNVAASPIPTAVPRVATIIPGSRRTRRSPLPFMVLGGVAALAWAGAATLGALREPEALPELATADPPASTAPAPSAPAARGNTAASAGADAATPDNEQSQGGPGEGGKATSTVKSPPAASWTVSADAVPKRLSLAGAVAVAGFDASVIGYANGAAAWTSEGEYTTVAAMDDGSVVIVRPQSVVGLSSGDGTQLFDVAFPESGGEAPTVVAADADGRQVLVALADARFLLVTPAACAEGAPADAGECVRTIGSLDGEYLEPPSIVALGEDGTRYLAEEDSMRGFDSELREVFSASLPADVRSMVSVPGGRLALQYAQEAALLDIERCRGRSEVQLRADGATKAPAGCVLWRYGRALDPVPPAAVDTTSVALNERGKLQLVAEGDDIWKTPLGGFGPVVLGEGMLYTIAAEGDALVVAVVDATNGSVTATHPLPIQPSAEDRGQTHLHLAGSTLAAAVGPHIAVLTL